MADPEAPEELIRSMRTLLRIGQVMLVLAVFGFLLAARVPRVVPMSLLVLGVLTCSMAIFRLIQARRNQR